MTAATGIELALAGAAGGFAKSLVEQKGRVMLPDVEVVTDNVGKVTRYIHFGALANMALGVFVAYYTTHDPLSAFTAGITAVFLAEKLIEHTGA